MANATINGTATKAVKEDGTTTANGQLTVSDPDPGQAHTVIVSNAATAYGTWSIDADGNWNYKLNNSLAAVQALGVNDKLTDSFTVQSQDLSASKTVFITINGTNDVATIGGQRTGDVTEDKTFSASGTLTVSDKDAGQAHTQAASGNASYGSWTVDADGHWSYNLDTGNTTVIALNSGQTLTDKFTVKSQDGTDTETITVTIHGNGGATITDSTFIKAVKEDGVQTSTGTVTVVDQDPGESHTAVVTNATATYGTWSVDADGNWSYKLDNNNLDVQALHAGESLQDKFTITSQDGTASIVIAVTINGTNDVAFITGEHSKSVAEDSGLLVEGTLKVTDRDAGDAHTKIASGTASFGGWSVDGDGHWSYTLDDGNTQVNALTDGETLTDTFTVESVDGNGSKTVTITIDGNNDAPVLSPGSGSFSEDASGVIQDLNSLVKDPDDASFTWTVDGSMPEGFSLSGDGKLSVDLAGHYESLGAGQSQVVSFEAHVSDGKSDSNTSKFEFTVQGVNDAPVIGGMGGTLNYTENDAPTAIDGAVTVSDVDSANFNGGQLTVSFTANGGAEDQLSILNEGTGAGQIGISGSDVTYGGVVIGTFTGGTNGSDLVITFNNDAVTPAAAQALIQHIAYANNSDTPSTTDRTVTFTLKDGDGGTDTGNATVTVEVSEVNDAPVIGGMGGTLNYTENDLPTAIDSAVTVSDIDSANFNGGKLTVSFTANGGTEDQLSILNEGTGAGQIGVSGSDVTYGGVVIGSFTGGSNGSNLVITFNNDAATPAAAQALIQHIGYANSSDDPATADRTVTFSLQDGDGGTDTGIATAMVHVNAVNDAPSVVDVPIFNANEETNGQTFALGLFYPPTDPDSSSFTWKALSTVSGLTLDADGKLHIDLAGNYDSLAAGTTTQLAMSYAVSDGTSDSATKSITVEVLGVNDAPVIGAMGDTLNYTENVAPAAIDSAVTVADVDSANFNGGKLTVSFTANGSIQDQLSILNEGTGAGQIGVSGSNVSYGGVVIGSFTGGTNGSNLVITFNNDGATPAAAQALIQHIAYANSSDNPAAADRTVTFSLQDGDGTALSGTDTGTATATIHVNAVNDAPVVNDLPLAAANEEASGVVVHLAAVAPPTDPDSSSFTWTALSTVSGLTLDANGDLHIDLAGKYDSLAAGTTTPLTLSYSVSDGTNDSATKTITLQVQGINDAPVVGGMGGTLNYTENAAPTAIDSAVTVSDVDSANFNGGKLTVSFTANGSAQDQLSILNEGTGAGQIGVSGSNVSYGGVTIGTVSGGANGSDLVITFNNDAATPAAAQALIQHIGYANSSDTPAAADRTVKFSLQDGDGTGLGGADTGTATATVHVNAVNDAPALGGMGGTLNYTENAAPTAIDGAVTVSDSDSTNFNGGNLTVSFSANGSSQDQLSILNEGTGAGQIGISGSNVSYGGVTIGAFAGGANGSNLVITFNNDAATPAAAQALIQRIGYANSSDNPAAADRTVTFSLKDGDGGTDTGTATATVHINAVNDAPAIGGMGGTLNYTENTAPTVIDSAVTVSDIDSGNFNGGKLTVSFTANGGSQDQLSILNEGTGAGQIGVSGSNLTYGGVAIGSFTGGTNGSDLVISFNNDAMTPAAAQALIQHIAYANSSDNPAAADRTVKFTLQDGDGTALGGADTGTATATVHVNAVNDAPTIGGMSGTLNYTENAAPTVIDGAVTVADIDSANFNGGKLTASFTANGGAQDQLSILNEGTGAGQIGVSGSSLTYGGVTIGSFTGGANGSDLVISFNNDAATPAAAQALIQRIGYANTSDNPAAADRTVTFSLKDGDGGTDTGIATATVHVNAVNDVPVITSNGGGTSAAVSIAEGTKAVTTVAATDADGDTVTYSISGTDAALFSIDAGTGALAFKAAPSYADAKDSGKNNVYDVVVKADDGHGGIDTQALAVTVTNVGPVATDDFIYTSNTNTITLLDSWLTRNDVDPVNATALTITGVNDGSNDGYFDVDPQHSSANKTVSFNLDTNPLVFDPHWLGNGDSTSFTYTAKDVTLTDTGLVKVTYLTSNTIDRSGDTHDDIIIGNSSNEVLKGGSGNDIINGDGGDDVLFGGNGLDAFYGGSGNDVIHHGAGDVAHGAEDGIAISNGLRSDPGRGDVLIFDQTIDLTDLQFNGDFSGIETISMKNAESGASGNQKLGLSATDVLEMSNHTINPSTANLDSREAIRVDLDATDHLYLSTVDGGKWFQTGEQVNAGGTKYTIFVHETDTNSTVGDHENAYVMVNNSAVANVHLNQDVP